MRVSRFVVVALGLWSSWGVLPFRGYDFVVVQAPNRYILYYTKHATNTIEENPFILKSDVGRPSRPT